MKELLSPQPDCHDCISEGQNIRKALVPSDDSSKGNVKDWTTEDSTLLNVEKDIYALLDLCVHILELETQKKELSGMRRELRDFDLQPPLTLKKEEIRLRQIISATRKRLRYAHT